MGILDNLEAYLDHEESNSSVCVECGEKIEHVD